MNAREALAVKQAGMIAGGRAREKAEGYGTLPPRPKFKPLPKEQKPLRVEPPQPKPRVPGHPIPNSGTRPAINS